MVTFPSFVTWDEIGDKGKKSVSLAELLPPEPHIPARAVSEATVSLHCCRTLDIFLLLLKADFPGDDKPPGFALWTAEELLGHCLSV